VELFTPARETSGGWIRSITAEDKMIEQETESANRIEERNLRGAGGNPGGVGEFLLGFLLMVAGGYLLLNQPSEPEYKSLHT
jgi:hypothetical protein